MLKHSSSNRHLNPCQTLRSRGSLSYRPQFSGVTRVRGRLAGRLVRRAQASQRQHLPELPTGPSVAETRPAAALAPAPGRPSFQVDVPVPAGNLQRHLPPPDREADGARKLCIVQRGTQPSQATGHYRVARMPLYPGSLLAVAASTNQADRKRLAQGVDGDLRQQAFWSCTDGFVGARNKEAQSIHSGGLGGIPSRWLVLGSSW